MQTREVDPIWDKYMETPRGAEDLVLLLSTGDISALYKDRALQTLLASNLGQLPFTVNPTQGKRIFLGDYLGPDKSLRTILQGEWTIRAAQLVDIHLGALGSIDLKNIDAVRACYQYQHLIVDLLPVVPQQQAEVLFTHFRVDTPAPWDVRSSISSPYLLGAIYGDPDVDEYWKRKVAEQVHSTIQKNPYVQFAGVWDNHHAINYGRQLDSLVLKKLANGQLPISREFFQNEIAFLLSIDIRRPILQSWVTTAEGVHLLNDQHVRHSFLRRQFLPWDANSVNPRLFDNQEAATTAAASLLKLFPEDGELIDSIQGQLKRIEEQERVRAGQSRSDRDVAIIAKMKA